MTEWKGPMEDIRRACEEFGIDTSEVPDLVEVVRCNDCRFYYPPHIVYNDGTRKDVDETDPWVTADIGTNVGGRCKTPRTYCLSHDRGDPDDIEEIVCFRLTTDYCSYGKRRSDETD